MSGLLHVLSAKQTLGLNFGLSVTLACSGPTLETVARGHETGRADKNKSLINIWAPNKNSLSSVSVSERSGSDVFFFFLICAHIVEKLQANVLAIDHSANRCWRCISKVTVWIQVFSTTVKWLIWLKDVKNNVTVPVLLYIPKSEGRRIRNERGV